MPSNTHMPSRVSETDINSRFELRDQFSSPTGVIIEANLRDDGVDRDFFEVFGLPAGAFLEVEVVDENLNTVLGRFDAHGDVIEIDDNSGQGLLSRLTSIVPNDGVVNLAVSGFADFDFDGRDDDSGRPHGESGDYQLVVHPTILPSVAETDINSYFRFREPVSAPAGVIIEANLREDGIDRDFFEVFGLPAGTFFEAEVADNGLDTVLGRFDAHGNVIETDDNSGQGSLSLLSGIVPDDGVLNLAVSGFADFDFNGRDDQTGHPHGESGDYQLVVRTTAPPPPIDPTGLYFSADDGATGSELWKVAADGQVVQVADIIPGAGSSFPSEFTEFAGELYFEARDGTTGEEPWKLAADGSVVQVADINPGAESSLAREEGFDGFTEFAGELYFNASDGTTGSEPWKVAADGSVVQVADINPGGAGSTSNFPEFTEFAGELYFRADDGTTGPEPWKVAADGSVVQVDDIFPGAGKSSPVDFTVFDPDDMFV